MKRIDNSKREAIVKDKRSNIIGVMSGSFKSDFNVIKGRVKRFNSLKQLLKTDRVIVKLKLKNRLQVVIAAKAVMFVFRDIDTDIEHKNSTFQK